MISTRRRVGQRLNRAARRPREQAQSIRFVDMLSSIFDFSHSPEKMHEKVPPARPPARERPPASRLSTLLSYSWICALSLDLHLVCVPEKMHGRVRCDLPSPPLPPPTHKALLNRQESWCVYTHTRFQHGIFCRA